MYELGSLYLGGGALQGGAGGWGVWGQVQRLVMLIWGLKILNCITGIGHYGVCNGLKYTHFYL